MASTYLYKNQGTATNAKKFTYSVWIKRSKIASGTNQRFYQGWESGNNRFYAFFVDTTGSDADKLWIYAVTGGTIEVYWVSDRRFRDTNAWYHIVFSADSTQASQDDRLKVYVNGVQETSWTKNNNPSQNIDWGNQIAQSSGDLTISGTEGQNQMFDGLMSHIHFIDGTAYDASAFGSTDSVTGEWKINTSPNVNYGSQGYFILKDDNSNLDRSGQNNHFTIGGTLTKTEDNPSNIFATLNPLDGHLGNSTFTYGNTRFNSETSSNVTYATSTLGMVSGKFYFEAKLETAADHNYIGIADLPSPSTSHYFGNTAYEYGYKSSSGDKKNNNTSTSYGNTYTTNDIVMCAVDLDNLKVYFGKNGTWQNSGDPTSGSTGTGAAYTITAPSSTTGGQYFFCVADGTTSNNSRWRPNFGNGYFGDTAIASAGTNASNLGIFEYDVPTGYTALCTKGLNE